MDGLDIYEGDHCILYKETCEEQVFFFFFFSFCEGIVCKEDLPSARFTNKTITQI